MPKVLFEVLPGLPAYGSSPLPFPTGSRGHSEGLLVRFQPENAEGWTGNFEGYNPSRLNTVLMHPDQRHVVVIAGGNGYIVDPVSRREIELTDPVIQDARELPELQALLLVGFTDITLIMASGETVCSGRISWDGIRISSIVGATLTGEAYSPIGDKWHRFEMDLTSGACTGAIYPEEIARAVPMNQK